MSFIDGKLVYSVEASQKKEGETSIRRSPLAKDGLIPSYNTAWNSLQEAFLDSLNENSNSAYIGFRNPAKENVYETITYQQAYEQARKLANAMFKRGLVADAESWRGLEAKVVGIQSKNRKEWLITDIGLSYLHGVALVCLYDTLGVETVGFILNHSKPVSVFADNISVNNLLKFQDIGQVHTIICYDPITQEQQTQADQKKITLLSFESLINSDDPIVPLPQLKRSTVFTFSYTSGTTGQPKGAMVSHENMLAMHAVFQSNSDTLRLFKDDVYLSYLPLPHIFDRIIVTTFSLVGAQIFFYGGDVLKLSQDILDVKPTILASVPRLWNRFHDKIKASFGAKTEAEQKGIEFAVQEKLTNLRQKGIFKHEKWDAAIFDKIKHGVFGGRLRYCVTGAAPISKDVIDFLKICISAPILEGYGQTESTGASFTTSILDSESGHVGGPSTANEIKLVDVPEMNYLSTDVDENGVSFPRGEVCYRGPCIFLGYYKDDEKTKEAVDEDGWLHSGDIGKIRPNGSLQVIDRKKNIFKLAQGEYVAPEKVEGIYKTVKGISEIFVYGNSLKSTLVGIVIPDPEVLPRIALEQGIEGKTIQELCADPKINKYFLEAMIQQGKNAKLHGFEQVKGIHVDPTPMMLRGCLTSTMKLQRHVAKQVYEKEIEALYSKQE